MGLKDHSDVLWIIVNNDTTFHADRTLAKTTLAFPVSREVARGNVGQLCDGQFVEDGDSGRESDLLSIGLGSFTVRCEPKGHLGREPPSAASQSTPQRGPLIRKCGFTWGSTCAGCKTRLCL